MKRSINNKTPNKGGRPTKKLSEKRKYRITVKMATEEYYAMKLKAKNAGVSASEIVRMAIRDCHIRPYYRASGLYPQTMRYGKQPQSTYSKSTSGGCKAALRAMPTSSAVNGKHYRPYQPMMAKIVKGSGAKGFVDYILDKKMQATLIDCQGVLFNDNSTIARSFIAQSRLNPRVDKFIGHISLSFSKQDLPRLTDELMIQISREYMEKMGIRDTQYIIGRHYDKEHPHVHIAFNRVDNNGRTISDRNDRYRSERICKELTRKYGLYFANGKEQVKTHRLKESDKTRYEIYQVLKREVARCSDWTTLLKRLKAEGIDVRFKYKGNTNEVQGIIFTKNGYHFNGSKIDRSFSYSKIDKALNGYNQAEYQRQYEPYDMQLSQFENKESEFVSGSLGLLDFTSSPDVDSLEEADFRRQMQQKPKKKKTRGFKL